MQYGEKLPRALAMWMLLAARSVAGCGTLDNVGSAMEASERYEASTAAAFEMDVSVVSMAEDAAQFLPCAGRIEIVFTNTNTNVSARSTLTDTRVHGALPVGEYEVSIAVDGMQMGLVSRIGVLSLLEGEHHLGSLSVRFIELPGGTFQEQAVHAERLRHAYELSAIDFMHSPARGLLLVDARHEGAAS